MSKGTIRGVVALGIMLVLLAILGVGSNFMGAREAASQSKPPDQTLPGPALDAAKLATQWPQIEANAAAPARGSTTARYTLAEFGDFQCPQCGKVRPLLEKLLARYPSQVNLIFLHRPLPSIHQWALPAGQASEIAAAQGKFWPMYDLLYAHQDDLEPGFYGDYAAKAGLNEAQFKAAFTAGQGKDAIVRHAQFSESLGIELTPTLLLYDHQAKTVSAYVGLMGTKFPDGRPQYHGINDLLHQPPWAKAAS